MRWGWWHPPALKPEYEIKMLEAMKADLEAELEEIKKRIEELKKELGK